MKALYLAWLELRRFRGPWRRFAPVALILVPLLYGVVFLWSNWDPYGRMSQVPVAVVNSDRPAEHAGERVNAGEQFVQQLKSTDTFQWHFVDARTARAGLLEGRYYFTVQVPANFSKRLVSSTRTEPQRPALLMTRNDANGHLAGIMADTMRYELQNQINAAAYSAYARALYGDLGVVRGKLTSASEVSAQLVQGAQLGRQTTDALGRGLGGMRAGIGQVSSSAEDISSASAQLDQRLSSIGDFSAQQLPATVDALVDAGGVAVGDLNAVAGGTAVARNQAAQTAEAVGQLAERHPGLAADPMYRYALDSAQRSTAASGAISNAAQQARDTAADAHQRALGLRADLGPLQSQAREISEPVQQLRTSSAELGAAADGLKQGLNGLVANIGVAKTGAGQLDGGAHKLAGQVTDSLNRMPPGGPAADAQAATKLGTPSVVRATTLNPADTYGRGLAPLLFAIALWSFGLIAFLLFKPLNERAVGGRANPLSIAIGGWLPAAVSGVVGGLVLVGALDLALGLAPVDVLGTIGLVSLGAAAFVAIEHFLRAAFGPVGGLVSVALLVLQAGTCGGLYPMETAPAPFQALHPLLPMSYLVDGLRVTISGGEVAHLARDALVLGSVLVAFLLLTTLVVVRQRTWTIGRLHPQFQL